MNNFTRLLEVHKQIVDVSILAPNISHNVHSKKQYILHTKIWRGNKTIYDGQLFSKEEWQNFKEILIMLHRRYDLKFDFYSPVAADHRDAKKAKSIFDKITQQGHLGI